ncbi:MAG TPA: hypothetical protein VMD31_00740 [Opitutaceae bacterium]|nr:hypothetical protein [Opitutaceae bacterium]
MQPPPLMPRGNLPRLAPESYRAQAVVFWTHTIEHRARGWLTRELHLEFRELMLHAAFRERLLCPIYVLMPDHFHLLWVGVSSSSDQRRAASFLRVRLEPRLAPARLQHQAYDHVLRDSERKRSAFASICAYVAANPVRAGLVTDPGAWPFTGCVVPGYPNLRPLAADYWGKFWRIHNASTGLVTSAATEATDPSPASTT